MNNVPVIIPSYKNRNDNLISHVSNGQCFQDRRVIVYVYKSEYELYKDYKHIELRCIDVQWRSIIKKRHYIINDLKKRYDEGDRFDSFWFIDDDISYKDHLLRDNYKVDGKYKRSRESIRIDIVLDECEKEYNPETDGMISPGFSELASAWKRHDYTTLLGSPICCVLINFEVMRRLDLNYPDDDEINEDHWMAMLFINHNYYTKVMPCIYTKMNIKWGAEGSVASVSNIKDLKRLLNLYLKFGDACRVYIKKGVSLGNSKHMCMNKRRLAWNHKNRWDKRLVEIIKEWLEDSENEEKCRVLFDYLKDNKSRKDQQWTHENANTMNL